MPTSEDRIAANKANAAQSTGPKTVEGKAKSRRNALKHGLTGAGVVLPEADAIEVERRAAEFADELMAVGEVGEALARRAALNSVRMERAADQQTAALTARVRQVEADFVPPDGASVAEADKLRAEAVRIAMFDPSPEATLARRYEAAAERSFFRAIKELRQMEKDIDRLAEAESKRQKTMDVNAMMGSFIAAQKAAQAMDDEFDALYPELALPTPQRSANFAYPPSTGHPVDVPITVGRPR